jgi:hypothetical protein
MYTVYPPIIGPLKKKNKTKKSLNPKGRILLSDILGRRRPVGFVRDSYPSDMSAPRPNPTAYRGVYCTLYSLIWGLESSTVHSGFSSQGSGLRSFQLPHQLLCVILQL